MSKKHRHDKKDKKEKKHKHSRKRSSSDDSSGSSGNDSDRHNERRETRVGDERSSKKARKEAIKLAKSFGYSNESNPFGDANLFQPFVWSKMSKTTVGDEDGTEKQVKLIKEIEKVRKRRADREHELEEMERLREQEFRLREAASYGDWQAKEDEFHLEQTKVRSKLRLVNKREQPIDRLAKNILLIENATSESQVAEREVDLSAVEAELTDPVELFDQLTEDELKKLNQEIDSYLQLEIRQHGEYISFWRALAEICQFDMRNARHASRVEGVHKTVAADVDRMFSGKSETELQRVISDIEARLEAMKGRRDRPVSSMTSGGDVEYWENMLQNARVFYAKAYVRSVHDTLLQKQLALLEERKRQMTLQCMLDGGLEKGDVGQETKREVDYEFITVRPSSTTASWSGGDTTTTAAAAAAADEDDSPEALAMLRAEEERYGEDDEEKMERRDEVPVVAKPGMYWWQDKYRPRKPRYYNRVKTGYDWNKYNQTHYDHDNPPPKIVQGYKFNIFYPDLIDKTITPSYHLERADVDEFCIIRFHAGPPYEDIAFKIVNNEWEMGRRRGFRCLFERGVLQVHFNFKRHKYRR